MKAIFPIGLFSVMLAMLVLPVNAQDAGSDFTPLEFVENKGQWKGDFLFKTDLGGTAIFLKKTGFTYLMLSKEDMARVPELNHGHNHSADFHFDPAGKGNAGSKSAAKPGNSTPLTMSQIRGHAYEVTFLNANPNPQIIADKPSTGYSNYFIGNDPKMWASNVMSYGSITYKDLYPGIDVHVYSDGGQMKYDLIVHPGADPSKVALQYTGAEKLSIKKEQLVIQTSVGEAMELMPFAYQYVNSERVSVKVSYQLKGNILTYKISGRYDNSNPLVIDPNVVFSTLTGSRADNWGYTATYDPAGNFYAGGIVFGVGYPVTPGALQNAMGGGDYDIAITKFNPVGTAALYSTYLGGSGEEQPHSLVVDSQGNLVISGRTNSGNYPAPTLIGTGGGYDMVITKLNATGTGLVGSIKIGGSGNDGVNMRPSKSGGAYSLLRNYGDDARSEVIVDGADNIYVAGSSQSSNFPVTAGVFQGTYGGGLQDAVVLKINPACNALTWGSFLGGNKEDAAYVLALNIDNSLYVSGATASANFPGTSSGVYSAYRGGICDGYISHISNNGTTLINGTYIGSDNNQADEVYGVQTDVGGNVYVMGTTEGTWPVKQPPGTTTFYNDNSKQFIMKLEANLANVVYSTTFGKQASYPSISPTAFLVDRCQNVYVSGWGGELNSQAKYPNSGTYGLPVTPDARKASTDGSDFYFFVMERDCIGQLYGTFYGGNQLLEHVDGGTSRFDRNGVIYQSICSSCGTGNRPRFPTTPGAYASGLPPNCNLAALKIAFNLDGVKAGFKTQERKNNYCVPSTITFVDTTNLPAVSWEWSFGDNSAPVTTNTGTVSYTYNLVGDYTVRLIKYDPASCNVRDTAYLPVRIRADQAQVGFTATRIIPPCTSLQYVFVNNSTAPPGKPFTNRSFVWDFGDNTPTVTADTTRQFHQYATEGVYNVTLTLVDTNYCNAPEVITQQLRVAANVVARFETPADGCVPYTAVFNNTSSGGVTFEWEFGDGGTSTDVYPEHTYNTPGTYTVKMRAFDPNTCNLVDSTTFDITVHAIPVADFDFLPLKPQENTPTTFTNLSQGASLYWWTFGDGDTSTLANPVHQYNKTGTYDVCLVAENQFQCADTICKTVDAIVIPLFDVPSAFSPNGDGANDVFMVRGFGISKFNLKVFNRWGQLMFESNDPRVGWDGRFKGQIQPMDAYAFTVVLEFSDGQKGSRTGSVTLLR
ncbi:PKD domain-containing protein [Chitinophaga horti]|uniref:PKD domain-containing protein n=1 Tax=Chitinophaga horti TaxID=2920382 RepID=A0ABY6J1M2_9BACT|nr:PKD domain-containing protein [Chitinophaga horti]UYQ93561.1 PKD domain-containing protein [Chitinophaga horti]